MAEKDIWEKTLLSYADVFADCGNVFFHDGKQLLKSAELLPAPTESFYHGVKKEHKTKTHIIEKKRKDPV